MKPLDRSEDLQKYYQDRGVVSTYMDRRTAQPLNGLLHRRQVAFLDASLAAAAAQTVLEIACGPGRLTAAMRGVRFGVAMDASQPMLETAQQRMNGGAGQWSFLRSDAFVLPVRDASFDAVYTLRFIRHFQLDDRQRLYREIQRVLRPRGTFIVDALNRDVSLPGASAAWAGSLPDLRRALSPEEVEAELARRRVPGAGVEGHAQALPAAATPQPVAPLGLGGLARVLIDSLERLPGNRPSTWMLLCEKA